MYFGAVVEIAPTATGDLPAMLLAASYRASRGGRIMLVLRSTTRAAVDRILDPVVRGEGVDVQGLVYADGEDQAAVIAATRTASVVVATTPGFQATLSASGVQWCSDDAAPHRLLTLAAPTTARPARPAWAEREPALAGPTG